MITKFVFGVPILSKYGILHCPFAPYMKCHHSFARGTPRPRSSLLSSYDNPSVRFIHRGAAIWLFCDVLHARCSAISSASAHILWYHKSLHIKTFLNKISFLTDNTQPPFIRVLSSGCSMMYYMLDAQLFLRHQPISHGITKVSIVKPS